MINLILRYFEYNCILLFMLLGTFGMITQDNVLKKVTHGMLYAMLFFDWLLSVSIYLVRYYMQIVHEPTTLLTAGMVGIYVFKLFPLFLIVFPFTMKNSKELVILSALFFVNVIVYGSAFFCGVAFSFDEHANFIRGPLGYTSHVIGLVVIIFTVYKSIEYFKYIKPRDYMFLWYSTITVICSVLIDTFTTYHYMQYAIAIGCLFFSAYMYQEKMQTYLAKQKIQYEKQEAALLVSQIQPEFIYSTLDRIGNLCDTDSKSAGNMVVAFADYMRKKLDLSKEPNRVVPIDSEMNQIRDVASMAKLQNPELHVEYNLEDLEFQIPSLTIQMVVQDMLLCSDRIRIYTFEDDENHVIMIKNDPKENYSENPETKERKKESLSNVTERIRRIVSGTVEVTEETDGSMVVRITVPLM